MAARPRYPAKVFPESWMSRTFFTCFFAFQIDALSEIVDTVQGRIEVYLDGGIRTGSDVLKSLALGAKCVFIGRPAVWGLAYKVGRPSLRAPQKSLDVFPWGTGPRFSQGFIP